MENSFHSDKASTIRRVISQSFIFSMLLVLAVVLITAMYFNQREMRLIRQNNLQKAHETLSHLLVPAVSIADSGEILRLLSLTSSSNEFFAVIDNTGNILLPDYTNMQLVKKVFHAKTLLNECRTAQASFQNLDGQAYWINCTPLISQDLAQSNKPLGVLVSFSKNILLPTLSLALYFITIALLALICIAFWFRHILHRRLLKPLMQLSQIIMKKADPTLIAEPELDRIPNAPYEIQIIEDAFNQLLIKLKDEYAYRSIAEKKQALFNLAAKVAHDVRSPLTALEIILAMSASKLPEDSRLMMREAVHRIRDIANELLSKNRIEHTNKNDAQSLHIFLLSSIINTIVSEKRTQLRGSDNIDIKFELTSNNFGLFSKINLHEFKRILSNIFNNAIEAMKSGTLEIILTANENSILIIVVDNGIGITPEILQRLGEEIGLTYGKENGNGLGLYHAKRSIESWGGKLEISSTLNVGTQVTLYLPKEAPPGWFVSSLVLDKNQTIVILDDDNSIHQVWENQLKILKPHLHSIVNMYAPQQLIDWYKNESVSHSSILYLCDYEILNNTLSGLDVIEQLGIEQSSILITSRYEEIDIRTRCEKLGVRLIPKDVVIHVPVTMRSI